MDHIAHKISVMLSYGNVEMVHILNHKNLPVFFLFIKNCPKSYHLLNKSMTHSIVLQQNACSHST